MKDKPTNQKKRSVGIRLFGYCVNKLWLLIASLIVLTALIHVLLGLLLPKIDLYRAEIVSWVEETYDINIEVEKISADWSIQGPVIALSNFKIKSNDGEYNILEVGEISLYFDIITSLWDQRFSTGNIVIGRADFQFYIDRQLGVKLDTSAKSSVDEQSQSPSTIELGDTSQKIIDILFGQRQISITNSSLKLITLQGTQFNYHIDQVRVEKFENVHQLSGRLDYGEAGQISLVTELYGDPKLADSFSEIYLRGSNINIADLPWLDSFPIPRPSSGNLSWQFWGTWRENHWQSAKALVELDDTSWSELNHKVPKNHLSSMISWQHDSSERGYLSFHNMSVQTPSLDSNVATEASNQNMHSILPEIHLKYQHFKNHDLSWVLRAENLSLAPVFNYLGHISDNKQTFSQFLIESKLSLSLNQLTLSVIKQKDLWQAPSVELEFSDLNYARWKNLPRANGLTGRIAIDRLGGLAKISASNTDLEFGELFRHAIKADKLNSEFNWSFDQQGQIQLQVNDFFLSNPDFNVQARSTFFYQDNEPVLSLYAELTDVNAANKSQYLPVGVMSKNLVSYLDASVKSGNFPIIRSVVRGPMKDFPFANNNGLFVALGVLENATYQYLPEWPAATELNAKLLFEGSGMDIIASNAKSMNNQVIRARAVTKDFSLAEPILELSLDVLSEDNSARELINKTPINFISDSLQTINYSGNMRTNIEVKVGLSENGQLSLNGGIRLEPTGSKLQTPVVSVDNLKGEIKFTEKGISPSKIEAFYLGNKLVIDLVGQDKPTSPKVSLDVKGILPAAGISHFIGERWQKYFSGETAFSSLIHFSPMDKPEITRVLFQSELEGMLINFPDEFGKKPAEKSEIFLSLEIAKHSTGEIKWKGMDGRWYWDDEEQVSPLEKTIENLDKTDIISLQQNQSPVLVEENQPLINYGGTIYINKISESQPPLQPGLRVFGNIQEINLPSWLSFIQGFDVSTQEETGEPLVFETIEVDIKELRSPLVTINQSHLQLEKKLNRPWQIKLQSEQGNLELVLNSHKPWQATLNDINIQFNQELFDEQQALSDESNSLVPLDLVDFDILCNDCIFQQKNYGDIVAQLRKRTHGVDFSATTTKQKQHDLVISGSWLQTESLKTNTSIRFELQTQNVGDLLKKWDVDAAIEDSSGHLIAQMSWQDAPWKIDYSLMKGGMQLKLGKGYLSELSDEKGRLFSLFNLQSLIRKLTFDFKDVYKKGFFYDSITGSFQLDNGIISTENVRIKGNVADVKLYGHTDLKNQKIEQVAVITPHLTSSLPVLAAWAIEPTTGIIVYLLDKIMEPAVEVATRIDYRIHGNFDDVKVDTIKTSKEKVKVEYESEIKTESESKSEALSQSETETQSSEKIKVEKEHDKQIGQNNTENQSSLEEPVPL